MKPVVSALIVGVTLFCLALAATACNDAKARTGKVAQAAPVTTTPASLKPEAESPEAAKPADGQRDPAEPARDLSAPADEAKPAAPLSASQGFYVGMFVAEEMDEKKNPMASNKINVALESIEGEKVEGHSVVAGTTTPFAGTLKPAEGKGKYELALQETEGKDNGRFICVLDTNAKTLSGTWEAGNKKAAVTRRSYELVKTSFKYDPKRELGETWSQVYETAEDGEFEAITDAAGKINASAKLLKSKDVENMYKRDLEVVRNAIYARHGYSFRNRQMRYFFDNFIDWYVPVSTDVTSQLTDIETKNIALLKRYEKHADKYYDSYGR